MQVRSHRTRDSDLDREAMLVRRAAHDRQAFARLYDVYVNRVYRYAYRRLGDHADAEDITAQTFRRALEALPRYESRELPFGAWLFRIAHNLLTDRWRAVAPVSLDDLAAGGIEPADPDAPNDASTLAIREQIDAAWSAVSRLPPLQRRAIVLRFARGHSHAEVGALIGRSEAATKQMIHRALKTLRARLEVDL